MYNYVIVGAGLAGSVIAERIANVLKEKVLIIEKRNHIGGNCYDYYNEIGILIHKYGPHIFHTNSEIVWKYLSDFTDWNKFQLEVKANVNGKNVPLPFNLNTLYELFPVKLAEKYEENLIREYGFNKTISILNLRKSIENAELAEFIYNNIYLKYMFKQWGKRPEEIDSSVVERVPIRISRDNRYFNDKYQAMPKNGYTKMFEKILENKNINLMLQTEAIDILKLDQKNKKTYLFDKEFSGKIIYTGMVDELFEYKFGDLPYRSLKFKFENIYKKYYQDHSVISFPNNNGYTRITEYKLLTEQKAKYTTIGKEFPEAFQKNRNIPYYPIPGAENRKKFHKYKNEALNFSNLILVGRLAEYMYYNMDNIVLRALEIFEKRILNDK